ncbi:hypothetical protein KSP40_PGU002380 [Platanthera guangdongensis]|uniref:Uncharacterized protein n=1 Tax=Platanthera guangdongensis TaxID=2320717 RepID=A0ABR2LH88_9ASPA
MLYLVHHHHLSRHLVSVIKPIVIKTLFFTGEQAATPAKMEKGAGVLPANWSGPVFKSLPGMHVMKVPGGVIGCKNIGLSLERTLRAVTSAGDLLGSPSSVSCSPLCQAIFSLSSGNPFIWVP